MSVRFGPSVTFGETDDNFVNVGKEIDYDAINSDTRKFLAENEPPFASPLSPREMHLLSKFIGNREKKLESIRSNDYYKFFLQVAGASNRDLESLVSFPATRDMFPLSLTKVPSARFTEDLMENREIMNRAIIEAMEKLNFERVKMVVFQQADVMFQTRSALIRNMAGFKQSVQQFFGRPVNPLVNFRLFRRNDNDQSTFPIFQPDTYNDKQEDFQKIVNYYSKNLNVLFALFNKPTEGYYFLATSDNGNYLIRFADFQKTLEDFGIDSDVSREEVEIKLSKLFGPEDNQEHARRAILADRIDEFARKTNDLRTSPEFDYVRSRIRNARGLEANDRTYKYFSDFADLEFLFPGAGNPNIRFENVFVSKEDAKESKAYLLAQRLVNDLMAQESLLTHSTSRERIHAALSWLGTPELLLGKIDMGSILYNAISVAVTRIQMHVPSLSHIEKYEQIVKSGNNAFISLFAELVALMIGQAENRVPTRTQLDAASRRLERLVNKLIYSMRQFKYCNGKIVSLKTQGYCSTDPARYAY